MREQQALEATMTALDRPISLTMGPLLFNWPIAEWRDFYARIADEAPVDTVHIGEVVCSKRLPFYSDAIPQAVERLQRGGKTVVFSTLALITLPRERKDSASIVHNDSHEIEVNDIAALAHLREGQAFRVGPYVNVYNESTLRFLAGLGATSICLPPELPIDTVDILGNQARALHVGCEVWSFGRIPLAMSGRCYHARIEGLTKDSCQFVCARDRDGLAIDTVDGDHFLAMNGVQTLSHTYCNTIGDVERLADAGVTALRLSPHSCDMVAVAQTFRDRLDGALGAAKASRRLEELCGGAPFSNGFLFGKSGAEMASGV
jgi:collagenase-like PrtC family protease